MSEIVERLRQGIEPYDESDAEAAMDKAADEIERLRAENEWLRDAKGCAMLDMKEEIERLQSELYHYEGLQKAFHAANKLIEELEDVRSLQPLTEEIVNAIMAGIGADDIAVNQMLAIIEHLNAAGYKIEHTPGRKT